MTRRASEIAAMSSEELQEDWHARSEKLWTALTERLSYPGLSYFEQLCWRSHDERRCHNCGDHGTVRQPRPMLAQAISHYWLCDECWTYGIESIAGEQIVMGLA